MEFQGISGNFTEAGVEALAVAIFKDEKPSSGILKDLDKLTGGQISAVIKSEEFKGEPGETLLLRLAPKGKIKASRLLGRVDSISVGPCRKGDALCITLP